MSKRTLLLDGDIFIYQMASAVEVEIDWGDDLWTLHSDAKEAKQRLDNRIEEVMDLLDGTDILMALSSTEPNWRLSVLPSYKSNRKGKRKPVCYQALRQYVAETFTTFERPSLEGDDVLGILSTSDKIVSGEKVIVSIDKDMKTIPGLLYNLNKTDEGIVCIDEETADYWHFYQTLVGDTTDGYKGCKGVGDVGARKILGNSPTWDDVLGAFIKAGHTEEEALEQARVARILRNRDYDFKKKEPILWSP